MWLGKWSILVSLVIIALYIKYSWHALHTGIHSLLIFMGSPSGHPCKPLLTNNGQTLYSASFFSEPAVPAY